MSELLKRLENLSPEKRELILKKLHKQKQISSIENQFKAPPIEPVPRDRLLPLSFAQTRLWFLDRLEAGSANYNMTAAMQLTGVLHIAALEKTVAEIVRRHEVLRTNFMTVNDKPVQIIAPSLEVTLPLVDLRRLAPEEKLAKVQYLATEEQARPFDLTKDCLLRVTLLRLEEESHVLLVTMHHIVSDGWSIGIFIQEVSSLYQAFSQGTSSSLPELNIQYADFAHWQQQWLQGEVRENQLNYWKQQLAGVPPILELPTDRPRPPIQTFRGRTKHFEINPNLTQQLNNLSRKSGTTLFMTLMAAFVTLLYRYSKQSDIVIGSPIANRDRRETHPLIGLFVNTLVLRTNLEGNPSFEKLLQRVRQIVLDAYEHKDMPLEQLVEALQPERSLSHMPLFQVMFALQNTPRKKLELPGLTLTPLKIDHSTAKFDLTLSMEETESGLIGEWEYNSDLFNGTTISRMARHFQTLLANIVANPQERILELPILSTAERHQLLVQWNDTKTEYPQGKCIHQLFEEQVERRPDAVAVVDEEQQLTYRELNCRVNQLAYYLQTLGVKPEVLVGICVDRSLEMIVGLLAILKAGGAYLPLDPTYPVERLSLMLSDARVPVLLTQQHLVHRLPNLEVKQVCLDADGEIIDRHSQENPVNNTRPENLAYVIYTSGSTGKPKGVMIPHRGVNCLVLNTNYVQINASDVIAQVSNCSFDAATLEIWGSLLNGARLVVVSQDVVLSPQKFATCIREKKLGVMFLTTALFNQMAKEVPAAFQSMRYLLVGGEALDPRWIKKVLLHGAPENLLNVYGPTENTTFSTFYRVQDVSEGAMTIPIGRAIANTQTYILDRHLQPVPVGVPGELYLGGDGLALGYLNRPEITREKFIPNPFGGSQYLYKTGDLVKYLPDGNIEFISRIDNLVKIRGFRIELGEIEAILQQHPDVCDGLVVVRKDHPGEKRLVAYIVLHEDRVTTANTLRRFLTEKLPNYMVPSAFVLIDALPLTPNGKVDRRALPAPDISRMALEEGFVAPRTPTEEILATIWAEVLRVEKVGIYDNFFALGGHSLLATQIISRLRESFEIEISLTSLFETFTVAALAEYIDKIRWTVQQLQTPSRATVDELEEIEI